MRQTLPPPDAAAPASAAAACAGLAAACTGIIAVLAFLPAIAGPFLYDDHRDVALNASAQAETFFERLPFTVRPLLKVSYAVQDLLHGPEPSGFHAVNLLLHGLSAAGLVLLVQRLAQSAGWQGDDARRLAILAALLWSVHPALGETVAYVSGRSMGLSSLLVLGGLLAAIDPKRARPVATFLCAALAPLARETALIAPALLLWIHMTALAGQGWRVAAIRALPAWLGAGLAAMLLMLMPGHQALVSFSLEAREPLDALRANIFAVPDILGYWLMPWRVTVLPPQPVVYGWSEVPTLARVGALAAAASLAVLLRRRAPIAALGIGWALIVLVPTNSLIWRMDPVALRPLYLAGIGLTLALAAPLTPLRRLAPVLAAALVIGLALMAQHRAHLYTDDVALWADAAFRTPEYARAHRMHGIALLAAGRSAEARAAFETALALDPFDVPSGEALRLLDALETMDASPIGP